MAAPGWMTGGSLHGMAMGARTDTGQAMGLLFAKAPGARISAATATAPGDQVAARCRNGPGGEPEHAHPPQPSTSPLLPAQPADPAKRSGSLVWPTPRSGCRPALGCRSDCEHRSRLRPRLVVTGTGPGSSSWMPMMTASPAFARAAFWFLGGPRFCGDPHGQPQFHGELFGRLSIPVSGAQSRPEGHDRHRRRELNIARAQLCSQTATVPS